MQKLFPRLLTLQTPADAIVRFTNIKEDGDMLKILSHCNCQKGSLWIMTNATGNIADYQKMKQ